MDNSDYIHIKFLYVKKTTDQIRSVAQLCPTLCDPMNHSTPGKNINGAKTASSINGAGKTGKLHVKERN